MAKRTWTKMSVYSEEIQQLRDGGMTRPEKDAALATMLRDQQTRCRQTYGYRRMHLWLESQGVHHDPKTVLRVMKKCGILAEIRRKHKWVTITPSMSRKGSPS